MLLMKVDNNKKQYAVKKYIFEKKKAVKYHFYKNDIFFLKVKSLRLTKFYFQKKKVIQFKRKRSKLFFSSHLRNLVQRSVLRWKKTKKTKIRFVYRRLTNIVDSKRIFFKKLLFLKKIMLLYYVKFNIQILKKRLVYYGIYNNLSKIEKFLFFLENRVGSILLRLKYARSFYQATKFIVQGAVRINGIQTSHSDFLVNYTDIVELAFRFFMFLFTKRYIRYKKFKRRMKRRSFYLKYYAYFFKKKYFKKKNIFFFSYSKRFFEKSRRLVATIILRIPHKIKHRVFSKSLTLKHLKLLQLF
jgi:ribosomal protein S4